jgi:hypothetical protein
MRGNHDQCRRLPVIGRPPGHVASRLFAEPDIDQHDIRAQGLGVLDRLGATAGRPSHGYPVPLQHGLRRSGRLARSSRSSTSSSANTTLVRLVFTRRLSAWIPASGKAGSEASATE